MIKSTLQLKVIAGLMLAFSGSAFAATYTNVPSGANAGSPLDSFGNAPNPAGDTPKVGEVFSFTSAETLSSFSFYAIGNVSASIQLNFALWNPATNGTSQAQNNVVGATLFSTNATSEIFNSTSGITTLAFDNLALNLNANTKYVAYLSSDDPTLTNVLLSRTQTAQDTSGFGIGHAYLSTIPDQGWVFPFNGNGFLSLQYTAVTVAAVPEADTYAMLLAGLGLMGAVAKRRSSKQA